jgi:hypothetical protein
MTDELNITELDAMVRTGGGGMRPVPKEFALHERAWRAYKDSRDRHADVENYQSLAHAWRIGSSNGQ